MENRWEVGKTESRKISQDATLIDFQEKMIIWTKTVRIGIKNKGCYSNKNLNKKQGMLTDEE